MIFGPPNSGKTTACYLAKLGMEYHADQVVFFDTSRGVLRAWGDPFPAVFRPETLDFLPEIWPSAHRSTYADLSFYHYDKSPLQARRARSVVPFCSVFLDCGASAENREEAVSRLRDCMLFKKDNRFEAQVTTALTALAANPVYRLPYGRDPRAAATVIEKMLR